MMALNGDVLDKKQYLIPKINATKTAHKTTM